MALSIAFDEYLPFLGVRDDDPALNDFLTQFGKKPRRTSGYYNHLSYKKLGFEVIFVESFADDEDESSEEEVYVVAGFTFYGPGNEDGRKVYQGPLIDDVGISDPADVVRGKLGPPRESHAAETDAAGVHSAPTDFYDYKKQQVVFEYSDDMASICSLGLQIPVTD